MFLTKTACPKGQQQNFLHHRRGLCLQASVDSALSQELNLFTLTINLSFTLYLLIVISGKTFVTLHNTVGQSSEQNFHELFTPRMIILYKGLFYCMIWRVSVWLTFGGFSTCVFLPHTLNILLEPSWVRFQANRTLTKTWHLYSTILITDYSVQWEPNGMTQNEKGFQEITSVEAAQL